MNTRLTGFMRLAEVTKLGTGLELRYPWFQDHTLSSTHSTHTVFRTLSGPRVTAKQSCYHVRFTSAMTTEGRVEKKERYSSAQSLPWSRWAQLVCSCTLSTLVFEET
jgi:hypothetical protein